MNESEEVKNALLAFFRGVTEGDVAHFDDLVSPDAPLVIGTAPGELVRDRAAMRFGFETEGLTLTAGPSPEAYEEGSMGFAVDEPTFGLPDGSRFPTRVTAVLRLEKGRWKIVHAHFSVGVPDEEVAELTRKWAGQG